MKKGLNERAQAGIITTVLIILIVLVAVIIVWVVVSNVVTRSGSEIDINPILLGAKIESFESYDDELSTEVVVKRSSTEGEITGVKFIFEDLDGLTHDYEDVDYPNELETKDYVVTNDDLDIVDFIDIMKVSIVFLYGDDGVTRILDTEYKSTEELNYDGGEEFPTFFLDVGTADDDNQANDIFLDLGLSTGLSGELSEGEITYRTLDEGAYSSYFDVKINTSSLALTNGIPYKNAILEIRYKDVIDETNCGSSSGSLLIAYCRPYVEVELNYAGKDYTRIRSLGGLNDNGWKKATVFIEDNPWQTLKSIDGYFHFRIRYPTQQDWWNPIPIDYVKLSFVDDIEFHNQRELDRQSRGLIRSDYVETNTINPGDYADNFVVYSRNYLEKIYPNTIPKPDEIMTNLEDFKLETFEIAGNYEPLTFAIYAFEDLENVNVEITDLVNGQETIQNSNIEIKKVVSIDKRWRWGYYDTYGLNPWYLDDLDSMDINANSNQQIWITINVPENTLAGVYTGKISITGDNIQPIELDVNLEVFDIQLESPDATPFLYSSPYDPEKYYSDPRDVAAVDMAKHNINPKIYFNPRVNPVDDSIDWRDFPQQLNDSSRFGILEDEIFVSISENELTYKNVWEDIYSNTNYFTGDSSEFDVRVINILQQYSDFFTSRGVTPFFSFADEPGTNVDKRRLATHMNRLAKEAGIETWITYYPTCEKPLAGYELSFKDSNLQINPYWPPDDSNLVGYWDFEEDFDYEPGNEDDAVGAGNAYVNNGALVLDGDEDYVIMDYGTGDELHPLVITGDKITLMAWVNGDQTGGFHEIIGTANREYTLELYAGDARFVIRNEPDYGEVVLQCSNLDFDTNQWYHIAATYDGSQMVIYVNGDELCSMEASGNLYTENIMYTLIGAYSSNYRYWDGELDEVMIFDRSLSQEEILDIYQSSYSIDTNQEIKFSTNFNLGDSPDTISFSIDDKADFAIETETLKRITVNGIDIADIFKLDEKYQIYQIDISPHLSEENTVEFTIINNNAILEEMTLYFLEDFWRNRNWDITNSPNWQYSYTPDVNGDLGPMDPYLDNRVHALSYVTEENWERKESSNDKFSYYTTYLANQPVIINNRFLNGIYASALDAGNVAVYAYGDWGTQPYDDLDQTWQLRLGDSAAIMGTAKSQLVLPSWEQKVYNTLAYESLREGIEDSRIIARLEKAIEENSGAKADEARTYLDDLYSNPSRDFSRYSAIDDSAPIEKSADISEEVLFDLSGSSENFEFFDDMRRTMIDYIIELEAGIPSLSPVIKIIDLSPWIKIIDLSPAMKIINFFKESFS